MFPCQPQELEALLKSAHRPNYTCQVGTDAGMSSQSEQPRLLATRASRLLLACLACTTHRACTEHLPPAPPLVLTPNPPWPAAQVLTAVIKRAQLPGDNIDNYDSFANVKASAAFR